VSLQDAHSFPPETDDHQRGADVVADHDLADPFPQASRHREPFPQLLFVGGTNGDALGSV
jgi:hypothetical protein